MIINIFTFLFYADNISPLIPNMRTKMNPKLPVKNAIEYLREEIKIFNILN